MRARVVGIVLLGLVSLGPFTAPAHAGDVSAIDAPTWRAYARAIRDAAVARPGEAVTDLLVPTPADSRTQWRTIDGEAHLLVAILRYQPIATVAPGAAFTLTGHRWVVIPGQFRLECRAARCDAMTDAQLDLRAKQLLGLPPDADYSVGSTFWVKPSDLFRPCTDPRTASSTCPAGGGLIGTDPQVPTSVGGVDLNAFMWAQAASALVLPDRVVPQSAVSCAADFRQLAKGQCLGYPWTRLGYTYDWAPTATDEVGLTEFVAVRGATAVLESTGPIRSLL